MTTIQNQKIAIIGFGKEGQALANYFISKGVTDILICDQKLASLGSQYSGLALQQSLCIPSDRDIILKSPGVALSKITFQNPDNHPPVSSLLTMLFENLDMSKVVAVTGTKGKSTVSSLIAHILSESGKKVQLLGNIGSINTTLLDESNPEEYLVFELSSFQCQLLTNSPHIGIWTSFYMDHQDVHADMTEYFEAKANLFRFQKADDLAIIGPNVPEFETAATKHLAGKDDSLTFKTRLQGQHNQLNCELAYQACLQLGLAPEPITKAIENYHPLEGRIQMVAKNKGIKFFADDLATIPEATMVAIDSFKGQKLTTLIVGGYDKGLDYTEFAKYLTKTKIKNFICFEPTGSLIVAELDRSKVSIMTAKSMKKAVELTYKLTKEDEICLMSCASASFGMFKDAYDRGEQFRKYVAEMGA